MHYIHVNQNGIKLIPCDKITPLSDLKQKIGIFDTDSEVTLVCRQFSNYRTVIVCDKEAALKNLPIMGITRQGIGVRGSFVVASLVETKGNLEIGGMSQARIEIALREIKLVRQ